MPFIGVDAKEGKKFPAAPERTKGPKHQPLGYRTDYPPAGQAVGDRTAWTSPQKAAARQSCLRDSQGDCPPCLDTIQPLPRHTAMRLLETSFAAYSGVTEQWNWWDDEVKKVFPELGTEYFDRSRSVTAISCCNFDYVNFLLDYSWHVIVLLTLISVSLSAYSIFFYWNTFTLNPTIGFETRGTYLSNQRLALDNLIHTAAGKEEIKSRTNRAITLEEMLQSDESRNSTSTFEDYADYGFSDDSAAGSKISENRQETAPGACQQYFVLGTVIPYETITFMSKLIFKVPSFNSLFNMVTMKRLCAIDSIVDSEISLSGLNKEQLKRLPFSFNLPYYTMCLNMQLPSNSCYSLNPDDIEMFKSLVLTCKSADAPLECQLPIAQQLSTMIFQKNIGPVDLDKPMYIAVVLPITLSFDGRTNLNFYSSLLHRLKQDYRGNGLKLMGAQFGVKDGLFERKIRGDARLGAIAILLVVLIILLYTNSLFFTFCIAAGLILSIGVAFFVYTVIFGVKFFPFLNLLAMILVVAVGADDAFLFMYQYRKHKKEASERWSPVLNFDTTSSSKSKVQNSEKDELLEYHRRRVVSSLSEALSHAAIAMFVTSATTAVAFFANLASKIMVLRCFGIYAGTMMLINYILVITILPAAIVVTDARAKSFGTLRCVIARLKSRFAKFWHTAARCFDLAFATLIPQIVNIVRIPLIPLAMAAFVASIYAIVKTPGIRLPEKNSMQFLRSNHPYEWFDEHAATLFDFSNGQRIKMNLIAVWGIKPTTTGSTLIPADTGSLDVDSGFADALANHLIEFQALLKDLTIETSGDASTELWLDGFIRWTQFKTISKGCQMLGENQTNTTAQRSLTADMLTRCLLLYGQNASLPIFDELQTTDGDGPIFDKNGGFLGYFLVAKSVYNFSTVFNEMKPFFDFLDEARGVVQRCDVAEFRDPLMLTSRQMTTLYDLLERILNGTAISVLISLVVSTVVIVFTTFHLSLSVLAIICIATVVTATIATVLWLGWTVNVVEATIIVLTIGMSFDYCLHFAVGFRLHGTNEFSAVASTVGVPVLLAAVSSFVAGLALVGASTQAFFEIGVFLMLMTATSFLVAVFVFPSMVTCLLHRCSPVRTITRL